MALKQVILIFSLSLVLSCKDNYNIIFKYNDIERITYFYLYKNTKLVDSSNVNDYYGSVVFSKFDDNLWKFCFKERGGTGSKVGKQLFLSVKNDKIIKSFEGINFYLDIEAKKVSNGNIFNDTIYLKKMDITKSNKDYYLKYYLEDKEKKKKTIKNKKVFWNNDLRIFYTEKDKDYIIKIEDIKYYYDIKNNNWSDLPK